MMSVFPSRRLIVAAVVISCAVCTSGGAEEPGLLFNANFDAYSVKANFAKGGASTRLFGEESLQLRMWPGAYGNVNSFAYSKSETCAYPLKGNLDPRQGTVSFWVSSLGWKPSAKTFQWFVTARQPGFTLHVYKYLWPGHLYFYIEHPGKDGQVERLSCGTLVEDKDWTEGKWHKLDAVWNETGMKLYVDGILPKTSPKCAWLKSSVAFPESIAFPKADAAGEIVINASPVRSGSEKDERTAIDDIRVWARPLSDKEIRDAYEAVVPSRFGAKRETNALGIPLKSADVALDGRVDAAEWADASEVPLADIPSFSKDRETTLRGTVRVKRDGANLYVALTSNRPARNRTVTAHDGPVWEDDSFEVMLTRDGKSVRHLVINANGAVHDETNGQKSWESGAKAAVSTSADGWQLELEIPIAALGGLPTAGNFCLSAYRSAVQNDIDAVAWNPPGWAFVDVKGFGTLVATETPVSIVGIGDPCGGEIALKTTGAAAFDAFVERENGDRVTCGADLAKETWHYSPEPGKQRLVVTAKLPNGVEALRWENLYYVNRDIEVTYNCHTYDGFVEATATLAGKIAKKMAADGKADGVFQIVRKTDGKVVSEAKAVATEPTVSGRIPAKDLPAGDYQVVAKFGGDSAAKRFNMPDLSALVEKVGCEHTVPEPWSPVTKTADRTWSVLDRTYSFGAGPFPVSIVSRGSELFMKAPTLRLDGGEVSWSNFHVTETQPDYVKFAGSGSVGPFAFDWTSELWFDGFYLVNLGAMGTGALASLVLDYTLPREFARYVMKQGYRDGLFFWKNDRIEKRFDPLTHPAESLHWTTGVEKGFAFGCVSDANWANKPDEANVILTRDRTTATVTAKIVSRPVEVTKPLAWQFVMQGTPSRRLRKEWRSDNSGGYRVPTMQNLQFGGYGELAFFDRRDPGRWTTPSNYKPKWSDEFLKSQGKAKAKQGDRAKSVNKSHMPYFGLAYCMPMHVGTNEPEYDWFYHDAAKRPAITWSYKDDGIGQTEYCVCDTRVYDIYLRNMEWFLKNSAPNVGIYNDCAHTMNCDNERHGHGGTDAFGRKFSSVCWLPQREYFLREYRLVQKYGRIVKNHIPAADFVPFVMDFSDLVWPGEEFHGTVLENLECYTEYIPREAWQSVFNANITGVGHHMLTQFDRAGSSMPETKRKTCDFMNKPEWAERILAAALPHDVAVSAAYVSYKTIDRWWIIKEDLRLWDATFHGYWFDETLKTSTPDVLVSWYDLPEGVAYRKLIVASNFSRKDAPLGIANLPFPKGMLCELWGGTDLSAQDLQTLTVPAKKFVLIGVR